VRDTLANRLKHFTHSDIARVFCPEKSTFFIDEIDRGKVVCVSIPQRFKTKRRSPIGDEQKAKVFIANMANRVMFNAADEESAKIAADTLGKKSIKSADMLIRAGRAWRAIPRGESIISSRTSSGG
jgi:hypothetical protein